MQAGDEPWLRAYNQLAPDVPVALLYYTRPTDEQLVSASTWLDAVNPALGNIDQAIVDRTHQLGLKTYVWTVNHGSDMNRGIDWGVDGIITDYPGVLVQVLAARVPTAARSPRHAGAPRAVTARPHVGHPPPGVGAHEVDEHRGARHRRSRRRPCGPGDGIPAGVDAGPQHRGSGVAETVLTSATV